MIKAVIFDMFETLITLFVGRTYFGEDIAADVGVDPGTYRPAWHATEYDRSTGKLTIEEGIAETLKTLGVYDAEKVRQVTAKRLAALGDSFSAIPAESLALLKALRERGVKVGLITNTFSDERDLICACPLFPYFDAVRISYEEGVCKPDKTMYLSIMAQLEAEPGQCLYVGDGGSRELYAARELGMKAVQAVWFHDLAFEPHVPCPILPDFPHAAHQTDVLSFLE